MWFLLIFKANDAKSFFYVFIFCAAVTQPISIKFLWDVGNHKRLPKKYYRGVARFGDTLYNQ